MHNEQTYATCTIYVLYIVPRILTIDKNYVYYVTKSTYSYLLINSWIHLTLLASHKVMKNVM